MLDERLKRLSHSLHPSFAVTVHPGNPWLNTHAHTLVSTHAPDTAANAALSLPFLSGGVKTAVFVINGEVRPK